METSPYPLLPLPLAFVISLAVFCSHIAVGERHPEGLSVDPRFVFVVDAGSTGSRLGRYTLLQNGEVAKAEAGTREASGQWDESSFIQPTLASMLSIDPADDPVKLQQAQNKFTQKLLEQVKDLGGDQTTMVYIMATAGVRESPEAEGKSPAELTQLFRNTYFPLGLCSLGISVEVLEPLQEAQLELTAARMALKGIKVAGHLGGGGASSQLTYEPSAKRREHRYAHSLPIGSKDKTLFSEDIAYLLQAAFKNNVHFSADVESRTFVSRIASMFKRRPPEPVDSDNTASTWNTMNQFLGRLSEAWFQKGSLEDIASRGLLLGRLSEGFTGTFVAMSGFCLGAPALGGEKPDCMNKASESFTVKDLKYIYWENIKKAMAELPLDDAKKEKKRKQSLTGQAIFLYHITNFLSDEAQVVFAKRHEGVDLSVNVGFALEKLAIE